MKRIFLCMLAGALLMTSCGIPNDEEPRAFSFDEIPQELRPGQLPEPTPVVAPATGETGNRQIHMIGTNNRLETVERVVVDTPEGVLRVLLNGLFPDERDDGITSAFSSRSSSVRVHDVSELFQLVTVDLGQGSLDSRNSEQKLGFAQIVFTLTSLDGIEFVDFIESNPEDPNNPTSLAVQTDNGTTTPGTRVSRADFPLLDPNLGPAPGFDIPIPDPTVEPIDTSGLSPVTVWEIREFFRDSTGAEVVQPDEGIEAPDTTVDRQLVGVVRLAEPTLSGTIDSLLSGVEFTDRNRGLRSALPPDAFLNSISVSPFNVSGVDANGFATVDVVNIAQVDLAAGSLPSATDGDERLLAAAQVVFTLTGLEEVDAVVFVLDGEPIGMPTDNGLSSPFDPASPVGLTRADYALQARGGFLAAPPPLPTAPPAIQAPTPTDQAETGVADETAPEPTPGG